MPALQYGDTAGRLVSHRIAAPFASLAAMAAIDAKTGAVDGMLALEGTTGRLFRFMMSCTLTADSNLILGASAGRWLALPNQVVDISMPITFATVGNAVLYTLPSGTAAVPIRGYWEVTTPFTGGTSSAVGLGSSAAPFTGPGDLLGGSSGDVAATLVAGAFIPGTIGADLVGGNEGLGNLLVAGNQIIFQRIASAFTAGAGNAHLLALLVRNAGA